MLASKKSNSSAPKFFCENCGAEVPIDEKRCPNCGSYFASVRCPACGFVGDESTFLGGCPACGYSALPDNYGNTLSNAAESKKPAGALPVWVYILTAVAFIAIVVALVFTVL